ncbi:Rid family detoxifying hydrolase [Aerococcus kribbianus]|uniref:Rid family detoxifying hydrolase n=1 Tax=Aerococcus kribbianus TaxID=2999064 RepID=A0A9X3FRX2_9LACT|nr:MULTISPECIES: Rid family detoxifying hydrolase [unclassified Aerococcus]MCZ0717272.1 Rid family detoxifying hydrolase [Aerococcus sp. YH-aer221]MCZ0725560.1 Rid family detoxifying hydrolase [Aerococcus sp. YH-aer222]
MRKIIQTDQAPAAIGPYVQAIDTGTSLHLSGQLPINMATNDIPDNIEEQTKHSLKNIRAIVEAAGYDFSDIIHCTIYLTDMADFSAVNEVYGQAFPEGAYPTRSCIAVREIPKGARVEIEALAKKDH